jgi:glycosyltransferase involved in cell wall biosynthesis
MGEIARLSRAVTLVPTSDPEAMAAALSKAIAQRQELPKLGELASTSYERYFRPERMFDEYISLYNRRIGHKHALHFA